MYWRSEKGERFVKREEIFKLRESGRSIREKKENFEGKKKKKSERNWKNGIS